MALCFKLNEKQTKKIEHQHFSFLIFDCGQSVTRHGMHLPLCLPHPNKQNPFQKKGFFLVTDAWVPSMQESEIEELWASLSYMVIPSLPWHIKRDPVSTKNLKQQSLS